MCDLLSQLQYKGVVVKMNVPLHKVGLKELFDEWIKQYVCKYRFAQNQGKFSVDIPQRPNKMHCMPYTLKHMTRSLYKKHRIYSLDTHFENILKKKRKSIKIIINRVTANICSNNSN